MNVWQQINKFVAGLTIFEREQLELYTYPPRATDIITDPEVWTAIRWTSIRRVQWLIGHFKLWPLPLVSCLPRK